MGCLAEIVLNVDIHLLLDQVPACFRLVMGHCIEQRSLTHSIPSVEVCSLPDHHLDNLSPLAILPLLDDHKDSCMPQRPRSQVHHIWVLLQKNLNFLNAVIFYELEP